ncbi:MAG: hypothetical protein PHX61_12375 [Alphaproteobacteria bacterium]|nr:hypothetical protein [Alphaproteobacteria bacterium]
MAVPAVAAVGAVQVFTSVVNRIIDAHTECKRIEAQMAALEAKYRIRSKELDLQEKALKMQHQQIMKQMEFDGEQARAFIKNKRGETKEFIRSQDALLKDSARLLQASEDKNITEEHRKQLFEMYFSIHNLIAQKFSDSLNQTNNFLLQISEKRRQTMITFHPNLQLGEGDK